MTDGNWAAFQTPTKNQTRMGDTDDWADFGGFESAVPATNPQASTTSGLISWAAFPATSPAPPREMIPWVSPATQPVAPPIVSSTQDWGNQGSLTNQNTSQAILANPIALETGSSNQSSAMVANQSSQFPTVCLEEKFSTVAEPRLMAEPSSKAISSDVLELMAVQISPDNELLKEHKQEEESRKSLEKDISALQEKLSLADKERLRMSKEIELLDNKSSALEEESKSLQEQLEFQEMKYSQMQDEHAKQLQDLRQAGHDALAIIVEEYKELSRQAVLQQQKECQLEIKDLLESEREKLRDTLKNQEENTVKVVEEERVKSAESMRMTLEAEAAKHENNLKDALAGEKERSKQAIEKAVQESLADGKRNLEKTLVEERAKHAEAMKDLMESTERMLQERIQNALQEEREKNKKSIQTVVDSERAQGREAVEEAINTTRNKMTEYLHHKQEMDAQVRLRQFAAMDLFLEGTRAQLKNLMESTQTNDHKNDTAQEADGTETNQKNLRAM
ncbi:predicted protein [Nematostella vectensis]|uniref:Uncharacterized protein n=1 Tax=Nematostella vectensis TaxID=45351 RepID=A7S599_NEMVE|nr:coiled-coil domain-containing protein 91 [Nematostella vectensis]EDO41086.1 predicted protein [Nematostella vectensis]|eukprot:XP_001633149.1 predicted protein [Nematostella vectensis]